MLGVCLQSGSDVDPTCAVDRAMIQWIFHLDLARDLSLADVSTEVSGHLLLGSLRNAIQLIRIS